jgi:6-phosphofructokinase 1
LIRRIAINTGGGDAPGLNAVIRAVTLSAGRLGWEVYGIRRGYGGLLGDAPEPGVVPLDVPTVRGITYRGGTILGTTNRGNPFEWPVQNPDGTRGVVDRSDELVAAFQRHGFDALVAVGGDGSLRIAKRLMDKGIPVVGVPKTIDNDLGATEVTFGFHTAVQTATDALDKLHSTAESHERVFVVELMGRTAGWIALTAGLAGTADVILIPEIPYDIARICAKVEARYQQGRRFAIIVAAEGAVPLGGEASVVEKGTAGYAPRFAGVAERLAHELWERTGRDCRSLVLGHLQRGGTPTAQDREIALRYGAAAVRLLQAGQFGTMAALHNDEITAVPLAEAVAEIRRVPVDFDGVRTARELGVSLGD